MLFTATLLTAIGLSAVSAQRTDGQYWPCNPLTNSTPCPPNPGLAQSTYSIDFTNLKSTPDNWTLSNYATVKYGADGAEFTFAKRYDSPQLWTDFYIFFGRVDVLMKCAPGTGIISSNVLISDDFDEIDWEWSGNNFNGSKGLVQNNYFPKGLTGTYDRGLFVNISSPQTTWHTYSVDWNPTRLQWLIDGVVVRTFLASQADTSTHQFPQSPSKLQLGLWDGGDKDENSGTVFWAGGYTDMTKVPYTMYVKSVKVTNLYPAHAYNYTDKSGSWQSIQKIQGPNWDAAPGVSSALSASSPILKPTGNTKADSSAMASATTVSGSATTAAAVASFTSTTKGGSQSSAGSSAAGSSTSGSAGTSSSGGASTTNGGGSSVSNAGPVTTATIGGVPCTISPAATGSGVVVNSITVTPGQPATTINGHEVSCSGSSVKIGSSTIAIPTTSAAASTSSLAAAPTNNYGSANSVASPSSTSLTAPPSPSLPPASACASSSSVFSVQSSALSSIVSAATSAQPSATNTAGNALCEAASHNSLFNLFNFIPFLGGNFLGFNIQCNVDYSGSDIALQTQDDFNSCVTSCNNYKGSSSCDACAFIPDKKLCYLKNFGKGMPKATVPKQKTYCALSKQYTSKAGRWRKRGAHLRRHAKGSIHHRR